MGMMCMLITSETKRINIHSHTHIWATHTKRGGWGDLGLLSDTDVYTHTTFTPVELLSLWPPTVDVSHFAFRAFPWPFSSLVCELWPLPYRPTCLHNLWSQTTKGLSTGNPDTLAIPDTHTACGCQTVCACVCVYIVSSSVCTSITLLVVLGCIYVLLICWRCSLEMMFIEERYSFVKIWDD